MVINGGVINGTAINAASSSGRNLEALPRMWVATRYRCYLTGEADGLPTDLELPISSFQTRLRLTGDTVLTTVIKGVDAYIDAIEARSSGMLQVWREYVMFDGTTLPFLMVEAAFDEITTHTGGRAGSTGVLTARGPFAPNITEIIALTTPIYYSFSGGKRRYRCELDPRLRPGDTALINGDELVVDTIIHIVDVKTTIMEISEV
ncbi:hypothetical protein [Methylobacter marinus]|uniref:hypothetical protein n=1 Tax=Methylobacter marinus TaxID=34058 RepID=UPI0003634BFC|nr:hypothetical protein [Methylobacter marinus]